MAVRKKESGLVARIKGVLTDKVKRAIQHVSLAISWGSTRQDDAFL